MGVNLLSVYSSKSSLSLFSNSSCLFLASSFSFFLFCLIHFKVLSTSSSASPKVAPFSGAWSSRRFRTLSKQQIWVSVYSQTPRTVVGLICPGKIMKRRLQTENKGYLLCYSLLNPPVELNKRFLLVTKLSAQLSTRTLARGLSPLALAFSRSSFPPPLLYSLFCRLPRVQDRERYESCLSLPSLYSLQAWWCRKVRRGL